MHWFETELLTTEENLLGLMALNRETLGQAEVLEGSNRVVLDLDSSESPVHGEQEGSAYNGHFESVCYHPLFLFSITETALHRSCARGMKQGGSGVRENASERKSSRSDINANWVWRSRELEDQARKHNLIHLAKCWVYKKRHPGGQNGNPGFNAGFSVW